MVTHHGTALFAVLLSVPSGSFVEALVNIPKRWPQRQQQQRQQHPSHHVTNTRKRRRNTRTHCLHCTAVALAVTGSSVGEADDYGASRSDGSAAHTGGTGEGERPSFVGEDIVVLSDWLEKSRQEGKVEVMSSREEQGARDRSPPHRFQELIQV